MAERTEWWKEYYVRYFVGTAFAIPLILLMANNLDWMKIFAEHVSRSWISAPVIAFAGLAYCYLASTPILLLHAVRAQGRKRVTVISACIAIVAVITTIGLCIILRKSNVDHASPFLLGIPFIVIVVSQIASLVAWITCKGPAATVKFYRFVSQKRAKRGEAVSPTSEFTESYRHLREHGNAVLILVMEVSLTLALLAFGKTMSTFALVLLTWILPSTAAWFIGTWLEGHVDEASTPI